MNTYPTNPEANADFLETIPAFKIEPPGRGYGPCAGPCTHRDCAWQRVAVACRCVLCGEPIGFGRSFYEYLGDVAHRSCLEGVLPDVFPAAH